MRASKWWLCAGFSRSRTAGGRSRTGRAGEGKGRGRMRVPWMRAVAAAADSLRYDRLSGFAKQDSPAAGGYLPGRFDGGGGGVHPGIARRSACRRPARRMGRVCLLLSGRAVPRGQNTHGGGRRPRPPRLPFRFEGLTEEASRCEQSWSAGWAARRCWGSSRWTSRRRGRARRWSRCRPPV